MSITPEQATRLQLRYINSERVRMAKLQIAWNAYKAAAKALDLHPLTPDEIHARNSQLDAMEREARTPEYAERAARLASFMAP